MSEYYVIGVRLDDPSLNYCFYNAALNKGDHVVVSLDDNDYFGTVENCRESREGENLSIYQPVIRKANDIDVKDNEDNTTRDLQLIRFVQEEADEEGLKMNVFRVSSSLDRQKVRIMYTADDRVDFRNLLRVLAPRIHARLDMHQVGPRDKAKMVGGLGICGLKLCCSTFLDTFEGISISMAKNQMLAINIPKLSGQCGKLICCLKYEDQAYSEGKKDFPRLGTSITYHGDIMKVSSFNVLNSTIQLYSPTNQVTISLEEYNAVSQGKPYVAPVKAEAAPKVSTSAFPAFTGEALKGLPPQKNLNSAGDNNSRDNSNRPNGNGRNDRRDNSNGRHHNGNNSNRYQNGQNQNRGNSSSQQGQRKGPWRSNNNHGQNRSYGGQNGRFNNNRPNGPKGTDDGSKR